MNENNKLASLDAANRTIKILRQELEDAEAYEDYIHTELINATLENKRLHKVINRMDNSRAALVVVIIALSLLVCALV